MSAGFNTKAELLVFKHCKCKVSGYVLNVDGIGLVNI